MRRYIDIELSILVDNCMKKEDINKMIEHSTSLIIKQDGVNGVASSDWIERIVIPQPNLFE